VLIHDRGLAAEMAAALGDRPVVLLRGHGLTSAAAGVEQAVLQAISVDRLARLSLRVVSAGGTLADLPGPDVTELPDLGSSFDVATAWRHELARARS
jgi:3,4-dihydroxyphthalate decarboxylase